ncbi:hypothetical protein CDL12_25908 [Handroanthus impetiginosus]|uniref:FAS1 domain-containing protein n=1 Tax=Handroanthus impetiginosus TaxID=429701 RepID=A0A2G9G8I2_9LAMI|nr:hypothetical protein CDL12_25908 [Handroanthus impetiginosus]
MSLKFTLFFSFFLLFHNAYAFNITKVLSQYPGFSTFNTYLTQTNLATQINGRQTITVLVVENGNLAPLSGKSLEVLKNILSVHVILDYFDVAKLQKLSNRSTIVTTLFQTSGEAKGQQGFLNITHLSTDSIAFGSAVPGSTLGSNLVKSLASQPYNLSVLQVSNVIVPVGIDGATNSTSSSTTSPSPSMAPSGSPKASPPPPSVSPNVAPRVSPATSPSKAPPTSREAPAPSNVPSSSEAPSTSPAPISDAPEADAPAADAPAPDAPVADSPSAATALHIGLAATLIPRPKLTRPSRLQTGFDRIC